MSFNFSLVVIDGDHRRKVIDWFTAAGFEPAEVHGTESELTGTDVYCQLINGRTVVDGLYQIIDEPELERIATESGCRTVQIMCGGTGGAYGFQCYHGESTPRQFCVSEGDLLVNEGPPIEEESGLRWDESTDEGEILALAAKFGFECDRHNEATRYSLAYPAVNPENTIPDVSDNATQPVVLDDPTRRLHARIGRIISTVLCLAVAGGFFAVAPRSERIPWPIELVLIYAFSTIMLTSLYAAGFSRFLKLRAIPDHWSDILDHGFAFQWRFALAGFAVLGIKVLFDLF